MEKYQVLEELFRVNTQIQEYRMQKREESEKKHSGDTKTTSKFDKLEKFSSNAKRILILLMQEENINQRSIAKQMDISSQAVSEVIKKLEQNGCVTKTAGAQNNENIISITDHGKDAAKEFKKRLSNHAELVFSNMTDKEIQVFQQLLCKIKK